LIKKPEGKRPLGTPKYKWLIILRWILEDGTGVLTKLIRFRIGTSGELL
jgi:hypothetical protein